jgi:hypothetical protein
MAEDSSIRPVTYEMQGISVDICVSVEMCQVGQRDQAVPAWLS